MPPFEGVEFEACYRRAYPLVLAKCRRMLAGDSDASDLAQEVFVRLWAHRAVVEDPQALTAWLYRTSTRLVIDRARSRALSQASLRHLEGLSETVPAPEERVASRQRLRSLVSECPAQELEAVILNRFDHLTQAEVAEVMGVGERTVRRLLGRFDERVSGREEILQ